MIPEARREPRHRHRLEVRHSRLDRDSPVEREEPRQSRHREVHRPEEEMRRVQGQRPPVNPWPRCFPARRPEGGAGQEDHRIRPWRREEAHSLRCHQEAGAVLALDLHRDPCPRGARLQPCPRGWEAHPRRLEEAEAAFPCLDPEQEHLEREALPGS